VPTRRGIPTMDLLSPPWERWFFAPFLFNFHASHHLHLTVPWYNLPRLHEALREVGTPGYAEVRGSYIAALARTMREPLPGTAEIAGHGIPASAEDP
jgi:fatty acid desaturase